MSSLDVQLRPGWTTATLSELGTWAGGGTPSKQNLAYWDGGDVSWVSPKDMGPMRLSSTRDHITRAATKESAARVMPADSITFVVRSGILSRTFPIALVPFPAAYNQDMRVLTPAPSVNVEWLLWALVGASEDIRRQCQKHGTTVASIDLKRLQQYAIPVPPRQEQARIVERLTAHTGSIKTGLAGFRRAVDEIPTFRRSVLQEALSGCGGSAASDGGPLPELPAGWAWSTIGEAGFVQLGRMLNQERHSGPNMRPYLRVANVLDDRLDLNDVKQMDFPPGEYERYRLHPEDILLNEGQSPELLGRAAMWRGEIPGVCFQKTLLRFRAGERVNPHFALLVFRHYLYSGRFRRESRITTGIGHLTAVRFTAMEFPMPPLNVQERIVAEVRAQLTAADRVEYDLQEAMTDADVLRRSVIREALRGRLTESLRSDEPADEVMRRVADERNAAEARLKAHRRKRRAAPVGSES